MKEYKEFKNENASKNAVIAVNWKRPSSPLHYSTAPLLHDSITPPLHYFADSCGVAQEPEAVNNPPSANPIPK
jgi:hypothetical protein